MEGRQGGERRKREMGKGKGEWGGGGEKGTRVSGGETGRRKEKKGNG